MHLSHFIQNVWGVKIHTSSKVSKFYWFWGIQSILFLEQSCYISLSSTFITNSKCRESGWECWECRESGWEYHESGWKYREWESRNQGANVENQGGNVGNQGGNAGNQGNFSWENISQTFFSDHWSIAIFVSI